LLRYFSKKSKDFLFNMLFEAISYFFLKIRILRIRNLRYQYGIPNFDKN